MSDTLHTGTMNTAKNQYHEIVDPAGFVNAEPFKLKDLIGKKVILLDFVTYSCINCQRTFPYLNQWYSEYKDQGLEIIGIHTPEFAFEKDIANVRAAAKKFGLMFPLVLDNDYKTWNAYGNQYWPRKYLIDIYGNIVYDHIGEGKYDETEAEIVKQLNIRKQFLAEGGVVINPMGVVPTDAPTFDPDMIKSPETYLGGARAQYLVNAPSVSCSSGTCTYKYKGTDVPQGYQLSGKWTTDKEFISLESVGAIRISFNANKVNLVAGSDTPVRARIMLDGKDIGTVTISKYDLYVLADLKGAAGDHILEVEFLDSGVKAYAFTFG